MNQRIINPIAFLFAYPLFNKLDCLLQILGFLQKQYDLKPLGVQDFLFIVF